MESPDWLDQLFIFLDVIIASVLTGIVGIERESQDKPAGIRTNIIVGGSSCLMFSLIMPLYEFLSYHTSDMVSVDPFRVFNALIIGVSFVGAGTILKVSNTQQVKGLTTAATLLYSTGIGVSVALHLYILAIGVTALTIVINSVIPIVLDKLSDR
jgi:putative Mg2+ transporter-C (MgtC) family protein